MVKMSDLGNLDIMRGNGNINPIERELANTIGESKAQNETQSTSHKRGNSSHENELRDFGQENGIPRQDRFLETMETFTNEINLRLFQEMDSMMPRHKHKLIHKLCDS